MLTLINPIRTSRLSSDPPHSSYSAPVAPELGHAFSAFVERATPENETRLHAASVALVHRLRDDGLPPERVVVALKSAIAKYGTGSPPSLVDESDAERHEPGLASVYRRVFDWCVDAYFDSERNPAVTETSRHADRV